MSHPMRTVSQTPNRATVLSPLNTAQPSPYGEFYGGASEQRADRLFVFVTREGRVMARHADGTVRDVTAEYARTPRAA